MVSRTLQWRILCLCLVRLVAGVTPDEGPDCNPDDCEEAAGLIDPNDLTPPVIFDDGEEDPINTAITREYYPDWSPEKANVWASARSPDDFTPGQIEMLAAHDITYVAQKGTHDNLEDGNKDAAMHIKQANPKTKVLFYWNSQINFPGYRANKDFNEEWALKDPDGELVRFRGRHLWYDHSVRDFKEWWIQVALGMVADPHIDGVFIDAIPKTRFFGYRNEQGHLVLNPNGERDFISTAEELRRRLPPGKILIGNALRANAPNGNAHHLRYLDGSYLENWHHDGERRIRTAELIQLAVKHNRLIMLNNGPLVGLRVRLRRQEEEKLSTYSAAQKYTYMQANIKFAYAFYLLVNGPGVYTSYAVGIDVSSTGKAAVDTREMEEFSKEIGAPVGSITRAGNVFARRFEHVFIRLNFDNSVAVVRWL